MNCHKPIKSCIKPVFLLAIVSFITSFVYAQDVSKGKEETKPSLELKLTNITPSLCIDSPLLLELEVTNISDDEVVVDISKLWSQFSYSTAFVADQGGRGGNMSGGLGIGSSLVREQNTVLHPGTSIHSSHEFSLAFDFFQNSGAYTLMTQINSVLSNEVRFELYDCGKTQKIEDKQ